MPNEVIALVHRLAIAAEKYDGIVFTDMDGNVLSEQFSAQDMGGDNNQLLQNTTGAEEQDTMEQPIQESEDSGAIAEEMASTTTDEDNMDEIIQGDISNGITGNNDENDEMQEGIDHECDSTNEERITIEDINIVWQMNSSQMAIDEEEQEHQPPHAYNLRERPTRRRHQVSLTQNDKTTGVMNKGEHVTTYPKTHAHVMLTQMNIKDGLLAIGEKGNKAILKELRQLHQKNALLPS